MLQISDKIQKERKVERERALFFWLSTYGSHITPDLL